MTARRTSLRGAVPASYVRILWEYLDSRHLDSTAVLGESPPDCAGHAPGRFPVTRWQALLDRAADALEDPDLGLHLGQTITPGHFGVIGYVAHSCETLAAALSRLDRYQRLVYDVSPMRVVPSAHGITLEWGTQSGRPGRRVDEAAITALVQFARDITNTQAPIAEVTFVNEPPLSLAPFEQYFGGKVKFGQPTTRVSLPLSLLQLPLQRADTSLRGLLEQQADALLQQLPRAGDLEQSVRRCIANSAGKTEFSLDQVASRLHMSTRTLHRQLEETGQNFRALRDDTLRRLAEQHLRDPGLSVAEVAQLLGYSEQSAFTRAFKRWSGQSPLAFRRTTSYPEFGRDTRA